MPPLLAVVGDAAWVAALTLLVLQAGFLLPPLAIAQVAAAPAFAQGSMSQSEYQARLAAYQASSTER